MSDLKISQFPVYVIPLSTDIMPIVDLTSGTTKKITMANLAAFFGGGGGGAAWGSITGTLSNQTDLQTALNAKQKLITVSITAPSSPSVNDLWVDIN